jgi:cytochrome c oxidase assembly protein subunit 15
MLLSLFAQAGMGAAAVMWPQVPAVLALHFGISLLALASCVLTTLLVSRGQELGRRREATLSPAVSAAIWAGTLYTYVVVYTGAFVRHTDNSLTCADWPLCGNRLVPDLSGPAATVFSHRVGALVLMAFAALLLVWSGRLRHDRPDVFAGSVFFAVFVGLQAVVGALIVFTRLSLFSTLAHAGTVGLLFTAAAFLCLQALPPARQTAFSPAAAAVPGTASA